MSVFTSFYETIPGWRSPPREQTEYIIGVLDGEGIGPEIINVALGVLDAAAKDTAMTFDIRRGPRIGLAAQREGGLLLTPEAVEFFEDIFATGGAVLCGPGGGRFVYDLRTTFDLFCKVSPLRPLTALRDAGVIKSEALTDVDILMVRENAGGIYFGQWDLDQDIASHSFTYRRDQVERIIRVAMGLATRRRRHLSLVLKSGGLPSVSDLWTEVFDELTREVNLTCELLQVDHAAYQLIQFAQRFDVVVSPNLFGDILADCGGLLLGSRGMCFSGNFSTDGRAVFQTGHGGALDLAGTDRANPIGQILSLSMMLEISFGQHLLAQRIEAAVASTLRDGWRTADIAAPGCSVIGTREMGEQIVQSLESPDLAAAG